MTHEEPKLTVLEQMKEQYAHYLTQKEAAQSNLNQLIGAIFACGEMIKKMEEAENVKIDD